MLRVQSKSHLQDLDGFTEFEDDIHFDSDDPDFEHHSSLHNIFFESKYLLKYKVLLFCHIFSSEVYSSMDLFMTLQWKIYEIFKIIFKHFYLPYHGRRFIRNLCGCLAI